MCGVRCAVLSISVVTLISCGGSDGSVDSLAGTSDLPKDTPVQERLVVGTDADVNAAAAGSVSRFGLSLLSDWTSQAENAESNFIFSPLSLYAALLMAQVGAENATLSQMSSVLQLTVPRQQANVGFNALDLALQGRGSLAVDGKLKMVNGLFLENSQSTLPSFLDTLAINFGAGVVPIDTGTRDSAEQSRLVVNEWFKQQTAGKFPDLLPPDSLIDARMVVANAVMFRGAWLSPFSRRLTRDGDFFPITGGQKTAPFMSQASMVLVSQTPSYDAVELPFAGGDFALQVVLPQIGQFQAVASAISATPEFNFLEVGTVTHTRIVMPKFKFETDLRADEALVRLGMPNAFDRNLADFSGIGGRRFLYIDRVAHKAAIGVDEEGAEASAVTAVVALPVNLPSVTITMDRPFFFAIRDLKTGLVAFVGRVMDPTL